MRKRLMSTNVGTPQPRRVRAGAADETPLQQAKRKTKPAADDAESGKPVSHLYQDVHGIHIPQLGRQGRAGPLRVSEIIAAVRYLHAVDAVHSSQDTTDADRLLIVLDGLPRLLAALSGVHEDIWAGATIDDAIAAATEYFQTRFKDTDIRAELDRLEDTLNDMVDRLAAMRMTVFGE